MLPYSARAAERRAAARIYTFPPILAAIPFPVEVHRIRDAHGSKKLHVPANGLVQSFTNKTPHALLSQARKGLQPEYIRRIGLKADGPCTRLRRPLCAHIAFSFPGNSELIHHIRHDFFGYGESYHAIFYGASSENG